MTDKLYPTRLQNDTIVDCIIEVRFKAASDSVADLLPGLLYGRLKENYPDIRNTPIANIPVQMRLVDPDFQYQPTVEFVGALGRVRLAAKALQITVNYPYPGWKVIRPHAEQVLEELIASEMVTSFERISVLYHNILFTAQDAFDLSPFELKLSVGKDMPVSGNSTQLRTEFPHDEGVSIVQIQTGAEANIEMSDGTKKTIKGPHLSVDTIAIGEFNGIQETKRRLNMVRNIEREIFFRMITPETQAKLGPVWE